MGNLEIAELLDNIATVFAIVVSQEEAFAATFIVKAAMQAAPPTILFCLVLISPSIRPSVSEETCLTSVEYTLVARKTFKPRPHRVFGHRREAD